jgi:predicted RNase H-like HicB family nuclease
MVVVRDVSGVDRGVYNGGRTQAAIDAPALVPPPLRAALLGCAEVEAVARPPVQGLPGLLPPDLAWSYRTAAERRVAPAAAQRRVLVTGVEPPAALGLAHLAPWQSASRPEVVLEGPSATPSRVLAELIDATFVEIHAHGIANGADSDASLVMLSPEPDGRYALTAGAICRQPLRGHPVVILAACHAAVAATYRHEASSLPAAFIAAGARAVIASTDTVSDSEAGAFFDDLNARIQQGASPAVALRDARVAWQTVHPAAAWVSSLLVFQ